MPNWCSCSILVEAEDKDDGKEELERFYATLALPDERDRFVPRKGKNNSESASRFLVGWWRSLFIRLCRVPTTSTIW